MPQQTNFKTSCSTLTRKKRIVKNACNQKTSNDQFFSIWDWSFWQIFKLSKISFLFSVFFDNQIFSLFLEQYCRRTICLLLRWMIVIFCGNRAYLRKNLEFCGRTVFLFANQIWECVHRCPKTCENMAHSGIRLTLVPFHKCQTQTIKDSQTVLSPATEENNVNCISEAYRVIKKLNQISITFSSQLQGLRLRGLEGEYNSCFYGELCVWTSSWVNHFSFWPSTWCGDEKKHFSNRKLLHKLRILNWGHWWEKSKL